MIGGTASEAAWAYASRAEVFFSLGLWLLIFELGRASVFEASKYWHQLKVEAGPNRNRSATERVQARDRLPTSATQLQTGVPRD